MCGDFNVTRFSGERRQSSNISSSMTGFSNFIEELNLVDLQLSGGEFTWSRVANSNLFFFILIDFSSLQCG